MEKDGTIVRASAREIQDMLDRGESRTDWARVHAMSQEDIERLADEEDGPLLEGWESTVEIGIPRREQDLHIRLDTAVMDWFRAHGADVQTRVNTVLRAFVRARKQAEEASDG